MPQFHALHLAAEAKYDWLQSNPASTAGSAQPDYSIAAEARIDTASPPWHISVAAAAEASPYPPTSVTGRLENGNDTSKLEFIKSNLECNMPD